MNRDPIARLLESVEPPPSDIARLRTIELAREGLARRRLAPRARARRRALAVAIGCVAIAAAIAAFTGPGRATAGWVADRVENLVGIDNEDALGWLPEGAELVATGTAPNGVEYELFADRKPCLSFLWSGLPVDDAKSLGSGVGRCGFEEGLNGQVEPPIVSEWLGTEGTMSFGLVTDAATDVRVTYTEPGGELATAPTQLIGVNAQTLERVGAPDDVEPYKAYVTFLPPGIGEVHRKGDGSVAEALRGEGAVTAVALNEAGERLGETPISWVRFESAGHTMFRSCGLPPDVSQCEEFADPQPLGNYVQPLPSDIIDALAADGVALEPPEDGTAQEVRADSREISSDRIRKYTPGTEGFIHVYLARTADSGTPVYVVRLQVTKERSDIAAIFTLVDHRPPGDAARETRALYEWYVVFDAVSGDEIAAIREIGR